MINGFYLNKMRSMSLFQNKNKNVRKCFFIENKKSGIYISLDPIEVSSETR